MKYILVKSRHTHRDINELPAIFETLNSRQVFDYDYHKKIIYERLRYDKDKDIVVYVTGMTPVLISVVNYCKLLDLNLTLYHHDLLTNTYRAQTVI